MIENLIGSGIESFYLSDAEIDSDCDRAIRDLLCACFTRPEHARFKTQRFFYSPYPHRWLLRSGNRPIAHLGIHEREMIAGPKRLPCGGIADVCVHPDFRGRGLMRRLLTDAHAWMRNRGWAFSILFGDEQVYQSSGYSRAPVVLENPPADIPQPMPALLYRLGDEHWPAISPTLSGNLF